jgi:hypothetical protein
MAGEAPQFLIDEGKKRVECAGIALVPGEEQCRRVLRWPRNAAILR